MYRIFFGIIVVLIALLIWARAAKCYNSVLKRIYRKLSDTGKIYALYAYDALKYIVAALITLVIVIAIAYTYLVEMPGSSGRNITIIVVDVIACLLIEFPLVRRIFGKNAPEEYVPCILLVIVAIVGIGLMLVSLESIVLLPIFVIGLIMFLTCGYGAWGLFNSMIKLVDEKNMKKVDNAVNSALKKCFDTAERIHSSYKVRAISRLVGDILILILEVLTCVGFSIIIPTVLTIFSALIVCVPGIIIYVGKIWTDIKEVRGLWR